MNNSESHRHACEVRRVAKMSKEARQEYYVGAMKHRRKEKVNQLIDDVNRMRKKITESETVTSEERREL